MHEFPDLLPWEEMTSKVKHHEELIAEMIVKYSDLLDSFLFAQKVISLQNESFQEQITTFQREQAETKELVYCLEKQIDALEKVVADLTAALPMPEKMIESVQSEPMSYTWIDESGVRHIQCVPSDLFAQALERLTPEQKRMLAQAQEDDCIF